MKTDSILSDHDCVEIYRGNFYENSTYRTPKRVVAFDFDETLGSFVDLELLWRTILLFTNDQVPFTIHDLLDLYPEFIRYGMMSILEYIAGKKRSGDCHKVYVYTNNQGPASWVLSITDYFNHRMKRKGKIFDHVIHAFKVNNRQIEPKRTSHNKTLDDFINCTLLPKRTAICFLDDMNYDDMKKERIYYIKPKAYRHSLSTYDIIDRFLYSKLSEVIFANDNLMSLFKEDFIGRCQSAKLLTTNRTAHRMNYREDILITQKIMYHVREFFLLSKKKSYTKKRNPLRMRFTRKKRGN